MARGVLSDFAITVVAINATQPLHGIKAGCRPNTLTSEVRVPPLPSGIFLLWWLFFYALGANERQEVFGVERVPANGLLSGGAQGDVYAAIVGQNKHLEIAHHLLTFFGTQVWILGHLFLDLVGSELVLFAKCF